VAFDEFAPGSAAAFWSRIETVFLEYSGNGGAGNLDAELFKLSQDFTKPPTGLPSDLNYQFADFLGLTRTPWGLKILKLLKMKPRNELRRKISGIVVTNF
jgi:hypothetical protein